MVGCRTWRDSRAAGAVDAKASWYKQAVLLRRVRGLVVLLASLAFMGCGTGVRGGQVITPSSIPRGKLVATFLRADCTDGRDRNEALYVDYVQGEDGAPFLVERSRAADWLMITNSFVEAGEIVFQSLRENRGRGLQEYRFPWDGRTAGKYSLAMVYSEPKGTRDRFRVDDARPHVVCKLQRVDPLSGAPVPAASAGVPNATALPGPATSAQGWGYDASAFHVGDRVIVEHQGSTKRGRVVQTSGTAYFVQLEDAPDGTGEWVEPSRVLGWLK